MRVTATDNSKDNLCNYCLLTFADCPKASHIQFGDEKGHDSVIECSEFIVKGWGNKHSYPIHGRPELGIFKRGFK